MINTESTKMELVKTIGWLVGNIINWFLSSVFIWWGWNIFAKRFNLPEFEYMEIFAMRMALCNIIALFFFRSKNS